MVKGNVLCVKLDCLTFTIESDNQESTMFERFLLLARVHMPFKIKCKDDSKLMRFLGFFVKLFNPRFNKYTTILGNTIYLPKPLYDNPHENQIPLFAHEIVHYRHRKRLTTALYRFLFLFPQVFAPICLLSLLAIWFSNWWLLSLLGLGLLSPIPAPGRVYIEKHGYLMSLAIAYWRYGSDFAAYLLPRIVKQFTGNAYYYMGAGSQHDITLWFWIRLTRIQNENYPDDFFKAVHDFLKEEQDG